MESTPAQVGTTSLAVTPKPGKGRSVELLRTVRTKLPATAGGQVSSPVPEVEDETPAAGNTCFPPTESELEASVDVLDEEVADEEYSLSVIVSELCAVVEL